VGLSNMDRKDFDRDGDHAITIEERRVNASQATKTFSEKKD
jgi:hypothetical protein